MYLCGMTKNPGSGLVPSSIEILIHNMSNRKIPWYIVTVTIVSFSL